MLATLALTFAGLLAFLGAMTASGRLSPEDFKSLLYILRGTHVAISEGDMEEYKGFIREAAKAEERAKLEKGESDIRYEAVAAQEDRLERLEKEKALMLTRLKTQAEENERLRRQVEAMKLDAERKQERLRRDLAIDKKRALSGNAEKFGKVLGNMDAEDVARDLEEMADSGQAGLENAARILRNHLKPNKGSEVLTEMNPRPRQNLLPLLENPYADVDPVMVVQQWKSEGLTPGEMRAYLVSMPVTQAFRVWRKLDRVPRDEVLELISPIQREGD